MYRNNGRNKNDNRKRQRRIDEKIYIYTNLEVKFTLDQAKKSLIFV